MNADDRPVLPMAAVAALCIERADAFRSEMYAQVDATAAELQRMLIDVYSAGVREGWRQATEEPL